METKYVMQVFACHEDHEQLTATKRFNSFSWAKRYMQALRARYVDDQFVAQIFKTT